MTVVHSTHPLRGQVFAVVQQSPAEVLIQLSNGQRGWIPWDWTDQAAPGVFPPGARFRLEHLLTLHQRVEALSHKKEKSGTIPSQSNRQAEGDSHATAGPVHMGPAFPGTARPGDRHFGPNDPAPMEPAGKGERK